MPITSPAATTNLGIKRLSGQTHGFGKRGLEDVLTANMICVVDVTSELRLRVLLSLTHINIYYVILYLLALSSLFAQRQNATFEKKCFLVWS